MAKAVTVAQPTSRVVRSRSALAEAVATWPGSKFDTTWALVTVNEIPQAPQLSALRHAAKTCDKVAAVVIPVSAHEAAKTLPELPTMLRAAGCDIVWVPAAEKPLVTLEGSDKTSLRIHLQALLAVLPSLVVIGRADAPMVRHWRLLQTEFGDVIDLVFSG